MSAGNSRQAQLSKAQHCWDMWPALKASVSEVLPPVVRAAGGHSPPVAGRVPPTCSTCGRTCRSWWSSQTCL
jgi:hypothetical protein